MNEVRYQVFVSSTFTDLKEEREKVLQAILQLRAFPAGMELFPVADEEQFDFIKREIESSDYYVVIVAGRYGSVDSDGLGFTEKEYDYARSIGKPVLAFVVRDVGKLIGDKLEQADAFREKLALFREKVLQNKLAKFYSNADELKSEVLHSLPSQFNLKPMRGWVRAGQLSLENLEELASLQREILRLKSENERLAAVDDRPETFLAHGDDFVAWTLDFNLFVFDQKWPTIRSYLFEATWNGLLRGIFSQGSSQVTTDEVKRRLTVLVVNSCPDDVGSVQWKEAALNVTQNWQTMPKIAPIDTMIEEILVQFSGLELLSESKETIYVPVAYSNASKAETIDLWRLTPKGQKQLALALGYRRV